MKIYSEVCKVIDKDERKGKNDKPYYSLMVSYIFHSEKKNEDFEFIEYVLVPKSVFDRVEPKNVIRLVGSISYNKDKKCSDISYYDIIEGK